MSLFNWLGNRAERLNVSYARDFLNTVRRKAISEPNLLPQIAAWMDEDEVATEVLWKAKSLPPAQAREHLMEAAQSLQKLGQRLDRDFADGGGSSSAAGTAAIVLSHYLYLIAARKSDDDQAAVEARLVAEEYEQFMDRLGAFIESQSPAPADVAAPSATTIAKPDPYAELRNRIDRLGSGLKDD